MPLATIGDVLRRAGRFRVSAIGVLAFVLLASSSLGIGADCGCAPIHTSDRVVWEAARHVGIGLIQASEQLATPGVCPDQLASSLLAASTALSDTIVAQLAGMVAELDWDAGLEYPILIYASLASGLRDAARGLLEGTASPSDGIRRFLAQLEVFPARANEIDIPSQTSTAVQEILEPARQRALDIVTRYAGTWWQDPALSAQAISSLGSALSALGEETLRLYEEGEVTALAAVLVPVGAFRSLLPRYALFVQEPTSVNLTVPGIGLIRGTLAGSKQVEYRPETAKLVVPLRVERMDYVYSDLVIPGSDITGLEISVRNGEPLNRSFLLMPDAEIRWQVTVSVRLQPTDEIYEIDVDFTESIVITGWCLAFCLYPDEISDTSGIIGSLVAVAFCGCDGRDCDPPPPQRPAQPQPVQPPPPNGTAVAGSATPFDSGWQGGVSQPRGFGGGEYRIPAPAGSQTPSNCLAQAKGHNDRWIQPGSGLDIQTSSMTQILQRNGFKTDTTVDCDDATAGCIMLVYHVPAGGSPSDANWVHAMAMDADGTWFSKNGCGSRYTGIHDPEAFARTHYPPPGNHTLVLRCYCK